MDWRFKGRGGAKGVGVERKEGKKGAGPCGIGDLRAGVERREVEKGADPIWIGDLRVGMERRGRKKGTGSFWIGPPFLVYDIRNMF